MGGRERWKEGLVGHNECTGVGWCRNVNMHTYMCVRARAFRLEKKMGVWYFCHLQVLLTKVNSAL